METDADLLLRLQFCDDAGRMGIDTSPAGQYSATATNITPNDDVSGGRGANGQFNGTTSNLQLNSNMGANNDITFTAWLNISAFIGSSQTILQLGSSTVVISVNNSTKFLRCQFLIDGNPTPFTLSSSTQLLGARWWFVAVTLTSGNQRIYVTQNSDLVSADGSSTTNYTALDYSVVGNQTHIGRTFVSDSTSISFFNGAMSDVRFYQRVLTVSEMNDVKNMTTRFVNATTDTSNNLAQPFVRAMNSKLVPCFILESLSPTLTATVSLAAGGGAFSSANYSPSTGPTASWTLSSGPILTVTTSRRMLNILLANLTFVSPAQADMTTTSILRVVVDDAAAGTTTTFNYGYDPAYPNPSAPSVANLASAQTFTRNAPLSIDSLTVASATGPRYRVEVRLNNPGSFSGPLVPGYITAKNGLSWSYNDIAQTFVGTGSFSLMNELVQEITYVPTTNFKRSFTMTTLMTDGFNTVTGSKNITPDNQSPVITGHMTAETYMPNVPLLLQPLSVSDPDVEDTHLLVSLSVLTYGDTAGTFSTTSDLDLGPPVLLPDTWSLFGTVSNLNTVLSSVVFTPQAGFSQAFTVRVSVSDFVGEMFGFKEFTPQIDRNLCFATNTQIQLPNRKTIAVQNLQPGMRISSYGRIETVVCVTQHKANKLIYFDPYVLGHHQHLPLIVSHNHLVRDENGQGGIKPAADMRQGRWLVLRRPVRVYHVRTTKWGFLCANGVMCETAAVTTKEITDRQRFMDRQRFVNAVHNH